MRQPLDLQSRQVILSSFVCRRPEVQWTAVDSGIRPVWVNGFCVLVKRVNMKSFPLHQLVSLHCDWIEENKSILVERTKEDPKFKMMSKEFDHISS